MARTARSNSFGEAIQHLSHIRLRVVGEGILRHTVFSLDDVSQKALPNLTMSPANNREPTKLANFVSQRIALEGKTTGLNEYFKINRIILFMKDYNSGEYPG